MFLGVKNEKNAHFFWVLAISSLLVHGKIPFMLELSVLSLSFSYFLIRKKITVTLKLCLTVVKSFYLYLVLLLLFVLWSSFRYNQFFFLFKEVLYGGYIVLIFIPLLFWRGYPKERINRYFIICTLLFVFVLQIGFYYSLFFSKSWFAESLGLKVDYNYLSLTYLIAFVLVLYSANYVRNKVGLNILSLYLIFLEIPVFFSGSRRGVIFLFLMNFVAMIFLFRFRKNRVGYVFFRYLIIVFFSFFSLVLLNSILSNASKILIVDYLAKGKSELVKAQYSRIYYRYKTIFSSDVIYSDVSDKLWLNKEYNNDDVIAIPLSKLISSKIKEAVKDEEYNVALRYISLLRYSVGSFANFIDLLPKRYTSLFLKPNLGKDYNSLPYNIPIPYRFNSHFLIEQLNGIEVKDYDIEDQSIVFEFQDLDTTVHSVLTILPLHVGAEYIMSFLYDGIGKDDMQFSVYSLKDNSPVECLISCVDTFDNFNCLKKNIGIRLPESGSSGLYWLKVEIKNNEIKNNCFSLLNIVGERKEIPNKIFALEDGDVYRYQRLLDRRIKQYENFKTNKSNEKIYLTSSVFEGLNDYALRFRPYGTRSVIESSSDSAIVFSYPKGTSSSTIFSPIPAIGTGRFLFSVFVQTESKPKVAIKRYPESDPHKLVYKTIKDSVLEVGGGFLLEKTIEIEESSSGCGAVLLTITNNSPFDNEYTVYNPRYELISLQDSTLSSYEYKFFKDVLAIADNLKLERKVAINKKKYAKWKIGVLNNFLSSRSDRWEVAVNIFYLYPLYKKCFGGGFDYLLIYRDLFYTPGLNIEYGYPHNPILSAFLYSGLFGGSLYLLFLVLSFIKYLAKAKEIGMFGVVYFMYFLFTMFSGNSHFSVPGFALLSLFPFVKTRTN